MTLDVWLALCNVVFCGWRAIASIRSRRLIAVVWLLIAYFAIFFVPVALTDHVSFIRGFFAEAETADHSVIHAVILYVVAFNVIFAASESLFWRLLWRQPRGRWVWQLNVTPSQWEATVAALIGYWLIGGVWWFWQTRGSGYRDYVEGASWASVIFWASSPLIVLAALRRRWVFATVLCVPFLYFCIHLEVRSFALLSLVPMAVVGFYQMANDRAAAARSLRGLLTYGVVVGALLVAVSIFVSQYKNGVVELPDSRMPFGVVETVAMVDRFQRHVGFDGLLLYGINYVNPFMKLFHVAMPEIADTPTVIAQLLEGVPADWPVLYHYPALIWTDAYISFAWAGLLMAVLWALVNCVWELLVRRSALLLALLLPYFCWHSYMLVRGAIVVASVPESYSLYLSLIPLLLIYGRRVFARQLPEPAGAPLAAEPVTGNLMS